MLKIIFAGTPEFAVPTLQKLIHSMHQVIAVYTQPDRPYGRGRKLTMSPIKQLALSAAIPIFQPESLRDIAEQQRLQQLQADILVVVAYGLILPPALLKAPRHGCLNVHASLLPRWRGAAPIQRAILAGDNKTGITIMQMDVGLDNGAILQQVACAITAEDSSADLYPRLAAMGATALLKTLEDIEKKQLHPQKQDESQVTYAAKITKAEAQINWQHSAVQIVRQIRAFNPWPVAFTHWKNQVLRIWRAMPLSESVSASPGEIIHVAAQGIDVACGEGVLRVTELQLPGGKRLSAKDFIQGQFNQLCNGFY